MLHIRLRGRYTNIGPWIWIRRYVSTKRPIDKVLIANRGEIACRVINTAKKLGIKTVAVYSDADEKARHVDMADEAYRIGPPDALESYLRGDKIIQVAKTSGAQAIHPGYGFLSENEHFARDVENSGLIFIGPPASAIQAMGSKSASKDIMIDAKVPVVPGYHGENQDPKYLEEQAKLIGYPVLLKPVLGGGGKGMRIIENPSDFISNLESCKREALSSFKDDRILIERYIVKPRHIEIQVFADDHGNVVHLFERDCSVQRKHQKIIEEAPAPLVSSEFRTHIGNAAVNAARAVGYRGAGTVEFIIDADTKEFYFMEMNTRLQVEHPVTEMITKQDLVEWQFRVAEGHKLPLSQEQLKIQGHAFEARIYAENPDNDFLPGSGLLEYLQSPNVTGMESNVRVDTGVRQGDEVSSYYDPMIAKLIVWDNDRYLALRRLVLALENYYIAGLKTNIPFLVRLATHPEFAAGHVDTGFIKRYKKDLLLDSQSSVPHLAIALARLSQIYNQFEDELPHNNNNDPFSPWNSGEGYRLNHSLSTSSAFTVNEKIFTVDTKYNYNNSYDISVTEDKGKTTTYTDVKGYIEEGRINATLSGKNMNGVIVSTSDGNIQVMYGGNNYSVTPKKPKFFEMAEKKGIISAPTNGTVKVVFVKPGDRVREGDPLVELVTMKSYNTIRADVSGVVKSVNVPVDIRVKAHDILVTIDIDQPE